MENTGEIRRPILIEPRSQIRIIKVGQEAPLTDSEQAYIKARQSLLGPGASGEITKEQVRQLVDSGITEVAEAVSKAGPPGNMANRGETFLGALQILLQDAKEVLEGDRNSTLALERVIDHATAEELAAAEARGKEITTAAKTGIGIGKDGAIYVETYPRTDLGQHSRQIDIRHGEELPQKVRTRASQVKDFIRNSFGKR